ncbi:AMP-binding enzyme family protein (macronuclear) [Tetrahymena thermophila SB210]|uniref:AMP-binding enzyme family protein n=1 Tax=Tetrahymena thermophila (strain SB210) TaxID=312017 RepID=W7XHL6_TETTS|nr:AMP-binding enzyme family protein [Tetrahymena thermophila SB210]EWS73891.1 AMP-binding enzyme family protein [Tetrahymena thermophila SB210]|eukprot:XP_012653575.1 AMP-binding enzyme family protein [Tetrahymena thermophila SB210]
MNYSYFDLFSQQFQFNINEKQVKKGTFIGALLTSVIILLTFSYFVYIMKQFIHNQIEPSFRSQSFISNGNIEMTLTNNLIGFRFDYDLNLSIESLEKQQNLTYIVYQAYYQQNNQTDVIHIPIDIIECDDSNLIGYKCLDFSKVSNYTLALNTNTNLQSQIQIFMYGCLDVDLFKQTIPSNCANQTEIDNIVNGGNAGFRLKLYTSQYNTTSQLTEVNYRNAYVYTIAYQQVLSQLIVQKQITSVTKGSIIQTESAFSSPIQYRKESQIIDRSYAFNQIGVGSYSVLLIYPDEIVQQIKIQYSSLPQVMSFVNSIFAFLMLLGSLGRIFSKNSLKKDIFMLFLKILYQDQYLEMMTLNKEYKNTQMEQQNLQLYAQQQSYQGQEEQQQEEDKIEFKEEEELNQQSQIPQFIQKSKIQLDRQKVNLKLINDQERSQSPKMLNIHDMISLKSQEQKSEFQYEQNNSFTSVQKLKQNLSNIKLINDLEQTQSPYILNRNDRLQQKYQEQKSESQYDQNSNITSSQKIKQNVNLSMGTVSSSQTYNFNQQKYLLQKVISQNYSGQTQKSIHCKKINLGQEIQTKTKDLIKSTQLNFILNTFKNKQLAIKNQKVQNFIQSLIFKANICKKKSSKLQNLKNQVEEIDSQIKKEMNIQNIFKDIQFLKKAVMLILNSDQLAALQLIGLSKNYLDFKLKSKFDKNSDEIILDKNLSHFEKQFAISQSDYLQFCELEQFLQRCSKTQNLKELDKRILSSLNIDHIS